METARECSCCNILPEFLNVRPHKYIGVAMYAYKCKSCGRCSGFHVFERKALRAWNDMNTVA